MQPKLLTLTLHLKFSNHESCNAPSSLMQSFDAQKRFPRYSSGGILCNFFPYNNKEIVSHRLWITNIICSSGRAKVFKKACYYDDLKPKAQNTLTYWLHQNGRTVKEPKKCITYCSGTLSVQLCIKHVKRCPNNILKRLLLCCISSLASVK